MKLTKKQISILMQLVLYRLAFYHKVQARDEVIKELQELSDLLQDGFTAMVEKDQ